jgi:phosphoribosylanthranilate isomerase
VSQTSVITSPTSRRQTLKNRASNIISMTSTETRGGAAAVGASSAEEEPTSSSILTKLRRAVFPIYGKEEVQKFFLIASIKFFIILALTLTRDTKDTLVVTQCGAEAIAFLKVGAYQ